MYRESDERPALEWEPVGTAGRARLTAKGTATDRVIDIDTIDISRAADRGAYARRVAEMFPAISQDEVERELLTIAVDRLGMQVDAPKAPLTLAQALDAWAATTDTPRIATEFRPLDSLTGGGLPLGSMTVLAGRPGAGKSALALQACIGAMISSPELTAVWGLGEMTPEALACRAVAVGSVLLGRDAVTMSRASRRSAAARAVADDIRRNVGERLYIASPLTLDRIEAAAKATKAGLLVVDYAQLVRVDGAADRRQEVDAVVKALREMAIAYGLALIVISNIAKAVGRDSRIGSLGKESSEIDFAADLFLLGEPDDNEDEHGLRAVRWRCMKNRHGRPYDIEATFDGSLQVFTAEEHEPIPEFAAFAPEGAR